jgi:hypothetical protein
VRVGITGHQDLPADAVADIDRQLQAELTQLNDAGQLTGVSSLAEGADQMFAFAVLSLNGRLEAIIPSADYESTFSGDALKNYQQLLASADTVRQLPFCEPSEEAFFAAGRAVVDECEKLLAIWDGKRAKGLGGTADVVRYAKSRKITVTVIWPKGLTRE